MRYLRLWNNLNFCPSLCSESSSGASKELSGKYVRSPEVQVTHALEEEKQQNEVKDSTSSHSKFVRVLSKNSPLSFVIYYPYNNFLL